MEEINPFKPIKPKKKWPWASVILTVLILIAVGLFVWRIIYYINLVHSGQIAELRDTQAKEMTVSKLAAAAASSSTTGSGLSIDGDPSMGNPEAKLTIVMFADFECPYSRQAAFTVRSLVYQNSDKVRLVYKDFPLTDLHANAEIAAEAAACADDQDKFWEMYDRIYQNQNDLSRDALVENARTLDLEMGRFISCLDNSGHKAEIQSDYEEGLNLGVYGTPTFFLNGQRVNGAIPADILRSTIEKFTSSGS
ncbi:MAG: thioredoxin domain-containing protein [Candidatus Uhrbacteria bacterium]